MIFYLVVQYDHPFFCMNVFFFFGWEQDRWEYVCMSKEMEAAKLNRRRKPIVEEGGDADITPLGVFCDHGHRVYHAYLARYCDKACRGCGI